MERSRKIMERAAKVIPGGVNSPVRACGSVGTEPLVLGRGEGPYVYSADNRRYIDMVSSWGPMILGHRHPRVIEALENQLKNGTSFGAPSELEARFAELVTSALPSLEMLRAVSSGTEATMSALRLARGFTGRDKIVKVDGGYHGHGDALLVAAGSGAATFSIPGTKGVTAGAAADTLLMPFNDLDAATELLAEHKDQIAAIIIEPVAGNMGVVPPNKGYLQGLRELCDEHDTLLIFDEVMTGFRVAWGGAQLLYDVKPDLTCLGKVIGGGMPAAAFGGRKDIMAHLAPQGPVYQAGTLSGNPMSMAAGVATLEVLQDENPYAQLEQTGKKLESELAGVFAEAELNCTINRVGSMMTVFFNGDPVENYDDAKRSNTEAFAAFFRNMRNNGISLPPSQFEAWFWSTAHTADIIDLTVNAARASLTR